MPTSKKYPPNWKEIVAQVAKRSGGRCECRGECMLHTTTGRCTELNGTLAKYARGKIMLTTAHLCHDETCEDMNHLRHMCNRCHLRYDLDQHMKNSRATRFKRKAVGELFG